MLKIKPHNEIKAGIKEFRLGKQQRKECKVLHKEKNKKSEMWECGVVVEKIVFISGKQQYRWYC